MALSERSESKGGIAMIYLDHHATTPVDPRVLEAMLPFFTERFGNPGSKHHRFGWEAGDAVEKARKQVAGLIGASAKEVVFTSGATEANNLAIKGVADALKDKGDHLVTVATEHKAVLDPMRRLEREGWRLTVLPVGPDGLVDVAQVAAAVTDRTVLVSVMAANNETGVLQPLHDIAVAVHAKGALLHTDAVQAAGKVPFDVEALGVDLASITAHKMYGPKGAGALYVRRKDRRVEIVPQIDGGGQERGLRSGTLNVPGIVGLGAAAELSRMLMADEARRLARLRDRLLEALRAKLAGLTVNGTLGARLPGNLNVSFAGIDGESLLVGLDDIAVSSGAACTAAEPSHVLAAMGLPTDLALASLRFGLGRATTEADVDYAAAKVVSLVERIRVSASAAGGRHGATAPKHPRSGAREGGRYSAEVLDRVQALARVGALPADAPDVGTGEAGTLDAGTVTRIQVRVAAGTVAEARYKVFGCSAAIASASLVAERLEGAPVGVGRALTARDVIDALHLPEERAHVAHLAVRAAGLALDDVEGKATGEPGLQPRLGGRD